MYVDLFDSPIYSFPITKDFSKNVLQSPTSSPIKTTQAAPVTASPGPVNVPRNVYEAQKREAERVKAALEGRDIRTEDVGLPSSSSDEDVAEKTYRRRGQAMDFSFLNLPAARRLGYSASSDDDEELPDAPPRQDSDLEEGEIAEGSRRG